MILRIIIIIAMLMLALVDVFRSKNGVEIPPN